MAPPLLLPPDVDPLDELDPPLDPPLEPPLDPPLPPLDPPLDPLLDPPPAAAAAAAPMAPCADAGAGIAVSQAITTAAPISRDHAGYVRFMAENLASGKSNPVARARPARSAQYRPKPGRLHGENAANGVSPRRQQSRFLDTSFTRPIESDNDRVSQYDHPCGAASRPGRSRGRRPGHLRS